MFVSNRINKVENKILAARLVKVFHLCARRNEWVDWEGDTQLMRRSGLEESVFFSQQSAEEKAETKRKQGSKFILDEVPAIVAIGSKSSYAITEVFTDSPLKNRAESYGSVTNLLILEDLSLIVKKEKWGILKKSWPDQIFREHEHPYLRRVSFPGIPNNPMGWDLKTRKMDLAGVEHFLELIQTQFSS